MDKRGPWVWILAFVVAVLMAYNSWRHIQLQSQAVQSEAAPAVIWYAPFLSGGGYCSEALSYLESMDLYSLSSSADVESGSNQIHNGFQQKLLFDFFVTQHGDSVDAAFLQQLPLEHEALLQRHWVEERDFYWRFKQQPIALAICHSEPGAWYPAFYRTSRCPPSSALYKVGRTMFETDRVPDGWAARMNAMDEIWVPTRFQQKVFEENGVDASKIHILPEAVDVDFFNPQRYDAYPLREMVGVGKYTTVFLSIFKWEARKGWEILLRGFFEAFDAPQDDVVLVVLTSGYHLQKKHSAKDFQRRVDDFVSKEIHKPPSRLPKVVVIPPHFPQTDMPRLYKAADVFVLPTRGEGWGRPHVEAMAMEIPVVSTFWSGTTEYMTHDNSYPLRIDGLVEIEEGAFRGHKWAEPSVEHLMELLRYVHTHPEEAKAKGRQARRDMIKNYCPELIGKKLLGMIQRVLTVLEERKHNPPLQERLSARAAEDGKSDPSHSDL